LIFHRPRHQGIDFPLHKWLGDDRGRSTQGVAECASLTEGDEVPSMPKKQSDNKTGMISDIRVSFLGSGIVEVRPKSNVAKFQFQVARITSSLLHPVPMTGMTSPHRWRNHADQIVRSVVTRQCAQRPKDLIDQYKWRITMFFYISR
jgi:hypothetical protein